MTELGNRELIGIHDVTGIFNLSIEAIRKYKALGLIAPCEKIGRKDLYNKQDIIRTRDLIKSYKQEGKALKEIEKKIKEIREEARFEEELSVNADVRKILIIEDRDDFTRILREYLGTCFPPNELRIYEARDGLTGIERAKRIRPDLIILDLVLPNISGMKVHETLIRNSNTRHSKFLIMSGKLRYKPENTTYIGKPFELDEFIREVETLLGLDANRTVIQAR